MAATLQHHSGILNSNGGSQRGGAETHIDRSLATSGREEEGGGAHTWGTNNQHPKAMGVPSHGRARSVTQGRIQPLFVGIEGTGVPKGLRVSTGHRASPPKVPSGPCKAEPVGPCRLAIAPRNASAAT